MHVLSLPRRANEEEGETNDPLLCQAKRGPFYVPSKLGERLMLPVKYLEDLKSAPTHEVDFVATFIEVRSIGTHGLVIVLLDFRARGTRCLRASTRQWVAAQPFIPV